MTDLEWREPTELEQVEFTSAFLRADSADRPEEWCLIQRPSIFTEGQTEIEDWLIKVEDVDITITVMVVTDNVVFEVNSAEGVPLMGVHARGRPDMLHAYGLVRVSRTVEVSAWGTLMRCFLDIREQHRNGPRVVLDGKERRWAL